jgi:FlaA1/EpsC-like NDP-sugar epimerase
MTSLGQIRRQPLAIFVDACIIINAYTLASLVLFARWAPLTYYDELLLFLPIALLVHCGLNLKLGLYRAVGRYVGLDQVLKLIQASVISVAALLLAGSLLMSSSIIHVLAMVPIGGAITFILMAGVRFYPRIFYERSLREVESHLNLMLVGAGSAGEMLIRSMRKEPGYNLKPVVIVDDDSRLQDLEIHGVPIRSSTERIPELAEQYDIDEIVIAIPSAPLAEFQRIWKICSGTRIVTKTLRPLQSIHQGKVGLNDIRDIDIEDVLGRQPVHTDYSQISEFVNEKVVLITGAGGSIGSELVLQISRHSPAMMILVDQEESSLYAIHERLTGNYSHNHIVCVADIRADEKMESLFRKYRPNLIFHAAAYKHVPLMELSPDEAVINNVFGTYNTARLAGKYDACCFVNISTDKAVEPVNVLGATKHLSERLVAELDFEYPATKYCSVRFGNVLGSRGSVIPIFRDQIRNGGPITITHPDMTRYFMLISEAVDLVLQAAAFPNRDGIYVLEMGKPVRIVDLARQMIDFMTPGSELQVTFTGLRPGEKLHEQLFDKHEVHEASDHPMIYRVTASPWDGQPIIDKLPELLASASSQDLARISLLLREWIDSYTPFDMNLVGSTEAGDETGAGIGDATVSTPGLSYKWVDDHLEHEA